MYQCRGVFSSWVIQGICKVLLTAFVINFCKLLFHHHDKQGYRPDKNKEQFASTVFPDKGAKSIMKLFLTNSFSDIILYT